MATNEFGDAFAPNSELASNEFLIKFAFKIRKIPSGFALVRQCREQATAGRTHASMSVRGHALHRKSRKENPQKPTQLTSRSHPRHLVGKRTAQKTPS